MTHNKLSAGSVAGIALSFTGLVLLCTAVFLYGENSAFAYCGAGLFFLTFTLAVDIRKGLPAVLATPFIISLHIAVAFVFTAATGLLGAISVIVFGVVMLLSTAMSHYAKKWGIKTLS